LDDVAVHQLDLAVVRRLDLRRTGNLRRTADVEGAHGELGARLADRLRRDHADRFADVDRRTAREVAAVALAADAVLELAGQHRTHAPPLDMRLLDAVRDILGDFLAALDDDVAGVRVLDVLRRGAAEDAFGKRGHDRAAVDFGLDVHALLGAAIFGGDDAVV